MKKKIIAVADNFSQRRTKKISDPNSRKRLRQTSVIRKLMMKKLL
jgi:hypothetical protein